MADLATIEGRIDKDVAGGIAVSRGRGLVFSSASEIMEGAKMMAVSGVAVPKHLRGNPGACFSVLLQAIEWDMSPFAVARKSYSVNDILAYEAQLVHAVIVGRAPIKGRLEITYSGDGPSRRCHVVANLKTEDQAVNYDSPMLSQIRVQNSPLWKSDPDQQLGYYAVRSLCRRHFPDILLGIYVPDEITPEPAAPRGNVLIADEFTGEVLTDGASGDLTRLGVVPVTHAQSRATSYGGLDAPVHVVAETDQEPQERPKRHRRSKAEMEAVRAAEAASAPPERQETPTEVKPVLDCLQEDLALATTHAECIKIGLRYSAIMEDLKDTDPEMADAMRGAYEKRTTELIAALTEKAATLSPLAATAGKFDWSVELENKLRAQPAAREFAEYLWRSESLDQIEDLFIEFKPRYDKLEPTARIAVAKARSEARRRFEDME